MDYEIRTLSPDQWPRLLHEIPDKPTQLFAAGALPSDDQIILCVVGSRTYSPYGKDVVHTLIAGLQGYPISIVSGLALGIDALAHKSALKAGLRTIAVPGSGLAPRVLYPASHFTLAQEILEQGGGLLSEFEPTFKATAWSFPKRNRIMAGMSHAVLVIEAGEKSGTLITSRLATEYNRDVLTVPGSIFHEQSKGPHMLIRLGATPVTSADDILEALHIEAPSDNQASFYNIDSLTENERVILTYIQNHTADKDVLMQQLPLDISTIQTTLMSLEIKGLIKEQGGEIIIYVTI